MPTGSFIQFGLFSEPDVNAFTAAYMSKKNQAKGLLRALSSNRAEFVENGVNQPLPGMGDVHLCRQRVIFSVSIPCGTKATAKDFKLMVDIATKLREGLSSVGLYLNKMNEAEYLALLRRFFRLYAPEDFQTDDFAPTREQVFAPSDAVDFETDDNDIRFNDGEYFAKILSIKHFPKIGNIGLMNMLVGDPMSSRNQNPEPFWMSATLHYPDQDKKISEVRLRHAWITNQSIGGLAHLIPALRYKKHGIDTLLHEMDGGGGQLCELNFTVTLFSKDKERLNGNASAFKSWASSFGFDMREDRRILKPIFYSFLPLCTTFKGVQNLYRFHTMAVTHAIRMLPIIGNWEGTTTDKGPGGASIFSTRRGTLALFDPYDSPDNYNGIISAGSGAGKTVSAQQLVCDWLSGSGRVWVIEEGRSYKKLCRALNGTHIEFSETSDICLNPFTKIIEIDDEMALLKTMFSKMASPEKGLDEFQLPQLESKIMEAYSKAGNDADADLVAQMCLDDDEPRIRDIGSQLYPFTKRGTYGRWFNGINNVDLSNDFVVLEIKDLENKKQLQDVVLIQLLASITREMYHSQIAEKGRRKYVVVEEGWRHLKDKLMSEAIEILYRTVRKDEGSAWLVTQGIGDIHGSASGSAILSSCHYKLIMHQDSTIIEDSIQKGHLKMDVYQLQMLKSVHSLPGKYSEMMIQGSDHNWGVVRLVIDRFSQILFSSKGWERDLVFEKMNAGEDVVEVISKLVKEGK